MTRRVARDPSASTCVHKLYTNGEKEQTKR
jgi:hypothetical protein